MAGTESDSASENPQEEQDMKTMFKPMMKEFKDLKQTVASLMDNSLACKLDVESDGKTSHRSHDKDADESSRGEAPSNSRKSSKNLLTEVVLELDITEKTGGARSTYGRRPQRQTTRG